MSTKTIKTATKSKVKITKTIIRNTDCIVLVIPKTLMPGYVNHQQFLGQNTNLVFTQDYGS